MRILRDQDTAGKSVDELIDMSIQKWRDIVAGEGTDLGTKNCALCMRFYKKWCSGCPISVKTGMGQCLNTPHEEYCKTGDIADAREELEFLKSLK